MGIVFTPCFRGSENRTMRSLNYELHFGVSGGNFGKLEGILIGISGGAALAAAIELAKREENRGRNIVVILPDGGDRYLSTTLYGE